MKKFERLGETRAPDGTVLALYRHDGDYVIRVNNVELMSTRRHHSEDRLAELVCAPLVQLPGAHVLIGGLGLGFTLRAALSRLATDATVVVAELLGDVIAWNRNTDFDLGAVSLADDRVDLRQADVSDVLRTHPATFDAIMLDVDNGAAPLTTAGNARLYGDEGIYLAMAALRPGGRLAYWSTHDDPVFVRSLRRAGLIVEVVRARVHPTSSRWHTLIVAHP